MNHFGEVLGLQLLERAQGRTVFRMELRPELCNVHGSAHGGVMMAALDAVGLWSIPPEGDSISEPPRAATASFSCNFLRAAILERTGALRATGRLVKRGRNMYFVTVELHSEADGTLLATGQGVYSLIEPGH